MQATMMRPWMLIVVLAVGTAFLPAVGRAAAVHFEELTLASESQWDGVDATYDNGSGDLNPFTSHSATFSNFHEWSDPWGLGPTHYWDGWAYSNRTDTGTTGIGGQYTAAADPAGGQSGSFNYGVAFFGWAGRVPTVSFAGPRAVNSAYFTNNAYAHDSMLNGDSFTKKFGYEDDQGDPVPDGSYPDWFLLTITGKLGGALTETVEFYLADYRSDEDSIVDDWTWVDLSSLGTVDTLEFGLTSSDTGNFGMNVPAYFAMDSMDVVPEPSTIALIVSGASALLLWRRRR